jgi:hypothetical protein
MEYIEIDRSNCMEKIVAAIPMFRERWEAHSADWGLPFARPLALDIAEFTDFAIDTIRMGSDLELRAVVNIVEEMLQSTDPIVSYAFKTMFLEQIAHRSSKLHFRLDRFIAFLQPLSYYHWQALDRDLSIYPA